MADVLAAGFGSVAGTRLAPVTLLSNEVGGSMIGGKNFVTLTNTDDTDWLFAKSADDPGAYKIALPGASCTICRGPERANNLKKIIGFGATPSEAGTATVLVVVSADKLS